MSNFELPDQKAVTPSEKRRWSTPRVILSALASRETATKPTNVPDPTAPTFMS